MEAGVITSIPYESTSTNTRQPIQLDSFNERPRNRVEPSPHHLNKGGVDFHQYPAFDPASLPPIQASHPSGPRPLNGFPSTSMNSDRIVVPMHNGRGGGANGVSNGQTYYGGAQFANGDRGLIPQASSDQTSVYSNSSPTRASSVVSLGNTSQVSFSASTSDNPTLVPTSQNHTRQPQKYSFLSTHHSSAFNSTTSFSPEGFKLSRPADDRAVEQQFLELMHKRGWKMLPDQARRQMENYDVSKKWTLVYQDRLTEWQGEQKRRATARNTIDGAQGLGEADNEGSPQWYVKRVVDNTITAKELGSLSVSLRTQPIGWVRSFVDVRGPVALVEVLMKINKRQGQGPAPATSSSSDKDLDREYDIIKCLKALMNNKYGADNALKHVEIVRAIAASLTSPRLNTRKLVSEVLTFLCHWADGDGHKKVYDAMDYLKNVHGENGRFDAWMRMVEVTIDGRGKMGSLVGASNEVRSGGIGMENLLMEYAVASLFLVNMFVDAPEQRLHFRCHIRAELNGCGISRILTKMEDFQYEVITKQVEGYRDHESIDYEDLFENGNSNTQGSAETIKDLNDPVQVANAIMSRVNGSRSQGYFLSAMQHMLLIQDNEGEDRLRMFQLVDSMLSHVAMDRKMPNTDLKESLNYTVQSLLDNLYTDSEARIAHDEALESRQIADAAIAERDDMRAQVELGADGVVGKLQKQIEEQQAIINLQARKIDGLKAELNDVQTLRSKELQRNELETRELYLMLRDAQDVAAAHGRKVGKDGVSSSDPARMQGILDREKLMDRLEMQLERAKTQAKLEGKVWLQVNPSNKLRELREEMDGEVEASDSQNQTSERTPNQRFFGSFSRSKTNSPPGERVHH